ncbi:uncharacterized protein HMPREF1541_03720 [Cyphellophora europaea CBS 101466]|uniref:Uncharacterized protein n=1 Tax=Cyphellophora europaea (strain CBS 101466) TaxID=1220924 RepID=W2S144_CYPE1|nr:uncharacterized protein HMPREF1541_03720 [Cyphellophora europaea CBS 101466]ETN41783.1 hypothetical protein HMPREF1541_03720 [Cyphellophora europaea CBS 101466]
MLGGSYARFIDSSCFLISRMFNRSVVRRLSLLARPLLVGRAPTQYLPWASRPPTLPARRHVSSPSASLTRRKDLPTVDTIYALSTAPGRAAIAIIRISGPACLDIYGGLCPNKAFPNPRVASLRKLYDPTSPSTHLDRAIVLYFPAPSTVTGEDILELHIHGGPAIVRSVLAAIPQCSNTAQGRSRRRTAEYSHIRPADAGEFTKRAFYNNRLSLPEAEALGDALAAETEQQRRLAVLGAESGLSERYESWRELLLHARGELEALIDFSEDQHFDESPAEFMASVAEQVSALQRQLKLHIANATRGELLRQGIRVALLGAPNAGKSSLLNRIVGREAAIVSAEEGTTRDIVDVSVDLGGWLVRFGDMAGLRTMVASAAGSATIIGEIEKEGIRRARARALQSDVVIVLLSLEPNVDGTIGLSMNDEVRDAASECLSAGKTLVVAVNKADLIPDLLASQSTKAAMQRYIYNALPDIPKENIHFMSCKSAAGGSATQNFSPNEGNIPSFLHLLTETFTTLTAALTSPENAISPADAQAYWLPSLTITDRQRAYLAACLAHLEDFLSECPAAATPPLYHSSDSENINDSLSQPVDTQVEVEVDIVTAAEHLRHAALCLAKITGRGEGGDVEDVLSVVFEK